MSWELAPKDPWQNWESSLQYGWSDEHCDSPSWDPLRLGFFDWLDSLDSIEARNPVPEALMNQDILNLIFMHFDLQPDSYAVAQTRKNLLSAAKTCRAFAEPALNSLWRILPSLLPLLLLLPSAEVYNGHYFVDELPLDDDPSWKRLDAHARRVRILYMEPMRAVISPNIYLRIGAMRKGPFLPGLKKIYIINYPCIDLSSALFLVSGSTLNTVRLEGRTISDRQFFVPFLSSLHNQSPGLTHLALYGAIKTSLEPIYRFTQLQSLELTWLCNSHLLPQLLQKLGRLHHLLYLIINTGSSKDVTASVQSHPNLPFAPNSKFGQLRELHIYGTTTSLSRILNEMKGLSNLTVLKIDELWEGLPDPSTNGSWKSTFQAISTFSAVEDLEITHAPNRPRGHYVLFSSSLAHLYKLNNMKSFVINFYNAMFLSTDNDFCRLADAFPKLKKIVIPPPLYYTTGGTLACLYHFSCKCPDLREITIGPSFNISNDLFDIKNLLERPISRNHRHPLKKLYIDSNFGPLEPSHLVQVAEFLDLIFPNLTTLETDYEKTTEVDNWAGIHELRLALQRARMNPS